MSESKPLIYGKISAIMDEMEAVPKANLMEQGQRYKYRSIDQVKNASNPLFAKHKVFYSPKVLEKEMKEVTSRSGSRMHHYTIKVLYTLFAEDGSNVECEVYGEAMDSGDKGLGKAQTYAEKVMLIQVLNIPLEDQPDPDHDKPELGKTKTNEKPPQSTQKPAEAQKPKPAPKPAQNPNLVSEPQLTRLYAKANEVGWTKEEAKALIETFGYKSSKDILKKDYNAIYAAIETPESTPPPPPEPVSNPPEIPEEEIPF
jgi:hypothetical protein